MNAEEHNIALEVLMEWGPQARVRVATRIVRRLPHRSQNEIAQLEQWARQVFRRALVLIEPVYLEKATREDVLVQLQSEVSFVINEENLSCLFNQGMYCAWHG